MKGKLGRQDVCENIGMERRLFTYFLGGGANGSSMQTQPWEGAKQYKTGLN